MKTCKLIAPAKVNLFLGIEALRSDGYHNVTTVMHSLAMHDTLQMYLVGSGEEVAIMEPNDPAQPLRQAVVKVKPGQGLQVFARNLWSNGIEPFEIPSDENLVCKAIIALAEELDRVQDETIRVVIDKHIPRQAGLGGGSSDAAAAIVGAAHLWGVSSDNPAIERAARRVGADVYFFVFGGCSLLKNRGDVFERALEPRRDVVALICPDGGVSTSQAYKVFDKKPVFFDTSHLDSIYEAKRAVDVRFGNNLYDPAQRILPEIANVMSLVNESAGVIQAQMSGSGSAIFAICETYQAATALVARASSEGYWARVTTFSGIGAAVLPDRSR